MAQHARYILASDWNEVSYAKSNIYKTYPQSLCDCRLAFGEGKARVSPTFLSHLQIGSGVPAGYNPTFQVFRSLNQK